MVIKVSSLLSLPLLMVALISAVMFLGLDSVQAHAQLVQASPAAGATLAESPTEIRLTFNEPLLTGGRITLYGQDFTPTIELAPEIDSENEAQLVAMVPPLVPGEYTVQWTAVSQDSHPISGSYTFILHEPGRRLTFLWLAASLILLLFLGAWYSRRSSQGT